MRRIAMGIFLAAVFTVVGWAEEAKPAPTMPSEVTLTSGRVLRGVEVQGWRGDAVIVRWGGRVETVPFTVIKSVPREDLVAMRAAHQVVKAAKKAANRQIEGQVFIVTRGRENYKIGDLNVYIVPKWEMDSFLSSNSLSNEYEKVKNSSFYPMGTFAKVDMTNQADAVLFAHFEKAPRGSIRTKTDADGRFLVTLPAEGEFYAFARDNRKVGGSTEWYVFLREIKAGDSLVTLSNSDLWKPEG